MKLVEDKLNIRKRPRKNKRTKEDAKALRAIRVEFDKEINPATLAAKILEAVRLNYAEVHVVFTGFDEPRFTSIDIMPIYDFAERLAITMSDAINKKLE